MASTYRTWADGDAFTAADAGTYFMRQVTIACNNSTDRDAILTPQEGMTVYREDINAYEVYTGSSWLTFDTEWQTYTPIIYTNGVAETIGNGKRYGKYFRVGKVCHFKFRHEVGSTTAWGGAGLQEVTLPVTAAYDANYAPLAPFAVAAVYRSGVGNTTSTLELNATGTRGIIFYSQAGNTPVVRANVTNTAPFSWSTGDVHTGYGTYEMA